MSTTNGGLTAKQARFTEEYLVDLNATQAAKRAGYSEKTAGSQGQRLLKNVEVAAAIAEAMSERSKRKPGRPSSYSEALATEICGRMADGESLRKICANEVMPDKRTVLRWLADDSKAEFRTQYAHARQMMADSLFDDAIAIADDSSEDWITTEDGKRVLDHEHVQRSRLRVDTRKWAAAKIAPKKYGERVQQDFGVQDTLADLMKEIDGRTVGLPNKGPHHQGR